LTPRASEAAIPEQDPAIQKPGWPCDRDEAAYGEWVVHTYLTWDEMSQTDQAPDRLWPRSVHPAVSSRLPVEDASDGLAERVGAEGLR
jgi:hypothetical protein